MHSTDDTAVGRPVNNPPGGETGRWASLAAVAVLIVSALFILTQMRSGLSLPVEFAISFGGGFVAAGVTFGLVVGSLALVRRLSPRTTGLVVGAVIGTAVVFSLATAVTFGSVLLLLVIAVPIVGAAALLGGAIGYGRKHGFARRLSILWLTSALVVAGAVLFWFANPGVDADVSGVLDASGLPSESPAHRLADVDNPALPGPYKVSNLHYGSGTNRQRPEYGADVAFLTPTLDAADYLSYWDGLGGRLRTAYWGFGPDDLPLNAQVWYPLVPDDSDGGSFPLVIIVHGNHRMFEFADPGFAYIGEQLASRGFIVASIDQNFLNGSLYGEFDGTEIRMRALLLLHHLAQWRQWSETPGHPFAGMVDMQRIALVGHSRGGEAVALANAYNKLPFDPDHAQERFDFNFNIRSLVTMAPVDGMYELADRPAPIQGVNYLLLTGMHDADVADLSGGRAYERVQLKDGDGLFKAALHIYGANHGQFNTTRTNRDLPLPFSWLINTRPLLSAEEQRQITLVYVSAFLEATMNDDAAYTEMFRAPRAAARWLPETHYIAHYADGSQRTIADFSEDADLTTTTVPGGRIDGTGLVDWRETTLPTIYGGESRFGAYASWDSENQSAASLALTLPQDLGEQWDIDESSVFILSLVHDPGYVPTADKSDSDSSATLGDGAVDFTVKVTFADGSETALPLHQFGTLWPTPSVKRLKLGSVENALMGDPVLPQPFELPLATFAKLAGTDAATVRRLEFVFDITPHGALYFDEIALARRPDAATIIKAKVE